MQQMVYYNFIILPKVFNVYIRRATYHIIYALNRVFSGARICFFNIKYQYVIMLLNTIQTDIRSKCIVPKYIYFNLKPV